jgi:hypothetical protein
MDPTAGCSVTAAARHPGGQWRDVAPSPQRGRVLRMGGVYQMCSGPGSDASPLPGLRAVFSVL